MLFNSFEFILIFLPITLGGFFGLGKVKHYRLAIAWLVLASLFFYGYWNPRYLILILGSIGLNYGLGELLKLPSRATPAPTNLATNLVTNRRLVLVIIGIAANLALLGYYKYANFFVDNLNILLDFHLQTNTIILPLAISFFTFQQIAYLVDTYKAKITGSNFLDYCLFVTFFPQLIAGPIVHHQEMMPQFRNPALFCPSGDRIVLGLTLFVIGLCKKVAIADTLATYANPVFNAALTVSALNFGEAWIGSLAYTFQLYFDFSGYADMAIGIAQLFGLTLPLNFFSPYKSTSITEFWRRWHMTLSRFLRDYLYIPLGGNRKGTIRRYGNLTVTMLLGGLWHGAGWTFIVWGGLHGAYLVVNHLWNRLLKRCQQVQALSWLSLLESTWANGVAIALTFLAVHVSWVFFRAESFGAAQSILAGMAGFNGFSLAPTRQLEGVFNDPFGIGPMASLSLAAAIAFLCPNTYELMYHYRLALETYPVSGSIPTHTLRWQPTGRWAIAISFIISITVLHLFQTSEFLYFDF